MTTKFEGKRLKDLQGERQSLLQEIELKRAPFDGTGKIMPAEEQEVVDRMFDDLDEYKLHIDHCLQQDEQTSRLEEHKKWADEPVVDEPAQAVMSGAGSQQMKKMDSSSAQTGTEAELKRTQELQRDGFKSWVQEGIVHMGDGPAETQFKALQADSDTRGGFTVAPKLVVQSIIEEIDDMVHLRALATSHTVERGQSIGAPTRDNDAEEPSWTHELATGHLENVEPFGMRELNPYPLAMRFTISNKMLDAPGFDIEGYWRGRVAYRMGTVLEKAMLNGTGVNQPLGVFTVSDIGIPTGRDVDASAVDSFTADDLIDAQYNIKQAYWARCRWLFSRQVIREIRKLKSEENQYIWQPGLMGQPDKILDFPFIMSEFAPYSDNSAFATGGYYGMFADFSNMWVVDSLQMETQRLIELYAERNLTGFIVRMETDAQPVLSEAFTRLKFA